VHAGIGPTSTEESVFINCPFDPAYQPLLQAVLFTTLYLGLRPRIALERLDSGESRISKILEMIGESRYAIHDLSRLQAREAGEYYRLNMPFELGLDVGCRHFGAEGMARKRCLILESEPYRYQVALSDLSGSDIAAHEDEPRRAVTEVRNWLAMQCRPDAPGPTEVWIAFSDFSGWYEMSLASRGFSDEDVSRVSVPELLSGIRRWLALRA
jgi:hypothetical protein